MRTVNSPYLLRARSRAQVAKLRPSVTQLGTITNFSAATSLSSNYTSVTGDLAVLVLIKNGGIGTTLGTLTWNGVAMTFRSGIQPGVVSSVGLAFFTIKGGATGTNALLYTTSGGASLSRIGFAAYDVSDWDGTVQAFTATHDASANHGSHSLACNSIGDTSLLLVGSAGKIGNYNPQTWDEATGLDSWGQGTTAGYAGATATSPRSNESVTVSATGSVATVDSTAMAAIALRNA